MLTVGMKVVALFVGKKGYGGWYGAVVASVANEDRDEYVLAWEDGETKDTIKSSSKIALPLNLLLTNRAAGTTVSSGKRAASGTDTVRDRHCKSIKPQVKRKRLEIQTQISQVEHGCVTEADALLKQQLVELMESIECPVCMERPADTALCCGHSYCCHTKCGSSQMAICPTCEAPVENRIKLFGASAPGAIGQALSDMIASDGWKSAMEDRASTASDNICAAQGQIVHLQHQLALAQDAIVKENLVIHMTLEAKTQENARLVQQHAVHLVALAASVEKRRQKCALHQYRIAELEVELAGNEYHLYAALEACKEACQQDMAALEANAQEGAIIVQQQSSMMAAQQDKISVLEKKLASTAVIAAEIRLRLAHSTS